MRKLLLLSALLIFACSSDDEENGINNNSQRLVESITVLSATNARSANYYSMSYDENNRLISFEFQSFDFDENGQIYYESEIDELNIDYLENSVIVYNDNDEVVFPINSDGTIDDNDYTFVNGYLTNIESSDGQDYNCLQQNNWVNNNITQVVLTCNPNFGDSQITEIEYTNHIRPNQTTYGTSGVGGNVVYSWIGLFGKLSNNFPLRTRFCIGSTNINSIDCWYFSETEYSYEFDSQGYPIVINDNQYSVQNNGNSNSFSSVSVAITYTN
jgi:hypothetical protein